MSIWKNRDRLMGGIGATIAAAIAVGSTIMLSGSDRASAAPQKGWVRVITDQANNIYYIDRGTIAGRGNYRFFWVYVELAAPIPVSQSGQMLNGGAVYMSVDCRQKVYRTRYVQLIDQNSKVIDETDVSDQNALGRILPGDKTGLSIVNYACARRR